MLIKNIYSSRYKRFIPDKFKETRLKWLLIKQKRQILKDKFNPEKKLFTKVLIETVPTCNNNCSFCPVHVVEREQGIMEFDLLERILNDLKSFHYRGKIGLFCNNEAFTDADIIEKIRMAKKILPDAYHYLLTNGINLTYQDLKELDGIGLDRILINNYNDSLELIPSVKRLAEEVGKSNDKLRLKVIIKLRKKNEVLTSRGGGAPNKKLIKNPYANQICLYPFFQININWKGEVFFCCNDVGWEIVVGDLKNNNIMDVWKGMTFENLRNILLNQGRKGISICSKCDSFKEKTI